MHGRYRTMVVDTINTTIFKLSFVTSNLYNGLDSRDERTQLRD